MSERKFVITDGSSLLSTCYYAVLSGEIILVKTKEERQKHYDKILHSENGTYTNGILGVLRTTASPLKKQAPDYIAFVFDKIGDTFRRKLYPDHKGVRPVTLELLKQQFALLEQVLEGAGFRVLYDSQFEVDDYAGSLVTKFEDQIPMVVMIKDHDCLQLVSDEYNIRVWMVQSKQEKADELYNKHYAPYSPDKRSVSLPKKTPGFTARHAFVERGVWLCQMTDPEGIQGDTSDNIPGVEGVAGVVPILLNEYKSVEDLYRAIHNVREDKTASKELQDSWKNGLGISRPPHKTLTKTEEGEACGEAATALSKQLTTIKIGIQIGLSLGDFSVSYYDESKMREWCSHLDIKEESAFGEWHQADVR